MKGLIEYLFYDKAYSIGCRRLYDDYSFRGGYYNVLENTAKEWYADPFIFTDKEHVYVFCEVMPIMHGKGCIGVTEFDPQNRTFSKVTKILDEPFHLSYPNVFRFNNAIYMIPETNQANEIRLYEAVRFPYKWSFKKTIVKDICAVDTSILEVNNELLILYTYLPNKNKIRVFCINMNSFVTEDVTNQYKALSNERPGGNVLEVEGNKYRIVQDCSKYYGERIIIYKIDQVDVGNYAEHHYMNIEAKDTRYQSKHQYTRIHTLTRDERGKYEAIDLFREQLYWMKPINLARRWLKTVKCKRLQ